MGNWMFFLAVMFTSCFTANGENHTNMKECKTDQQRKMVDCSHRNLSEIPNSSFPADTKEIDLSLNIITTVKNFTFVDVRQLEILDLSSNRIERLEPMAFVGLRKLLSLNLSLNSMLELIPEIFSPVLLEPLQQLTTLRIQMCKKTGPSLIWKGIDRGFSVLTSLEQLYMDFPIYFTFGPGFASLTKLKTLSTAGRPRQSQGCTIIQLGNNAFEALRHISLDELRLPNCNLVSLQAGTFIPLQNLTILDLSDNNEIGLKTAMISLYGLQGRQMKEINFSNVNPINFPSKDLKYYDMKYLKTICVRILDLSENFVFYKAHIPSFGKPSCLEMLNVSSRSMRCTSASAGDDRPALKHFKNINMKGAINSQVYTMQKSRPAHPLSHSKSSTKSALVIPPMPSLVTLEASNCFLWDFFSSMLGSVARYLPSLHSLDVSYGIYDCSFNYIVDTLTELDVSGYLCSHFYDYLYFYPLLRKLTVRNVPILRTTIGNPEGAGDTFQSLFNLEEIDLSGNELTGLNRNVFTTNTGLRSITLSNNKLQRVPSAIMHLKNISRLDLSANAFTHLNSEEMLLFDRFSEKQYGQSRFRLNFGLNPIQCTCETLDFIRWVYRKKRFLIAAGNFTCVLSNGSRVNLNDFKSEFNNLTVSCISHTWLIVAVISILFVSLLILLLYVVYRYRVNLRYWFYTKLQPPVEMLVQKEYMYDAFVAYTEDNYQWVYDDLHKVIENGEKPIKLCLHNRDFTPGKPIHENIVDKMRQSRKIVLVVSVDFLNSTYGPLEIEYAGMKSLEEGREDIIVCILLEEIPAREMPKALRNLWHKITFLKWSVDPREQLHFWQKLREAITNNVM